MVRTSDIVLVLVAILFPPASTAFLTGCSCDLLITICLTVLGYIPGHLHAFYLIYQHVKAEERYGAGNVKYDGNGEWAPRDHARVEALPPSYGTTTYGTA
ncbi:hypothetical protein JCM10207_006211 [Rhodosporidiobolus poonsookiae]